ncbi:MAG: hypothetical protein WA323_18895, partial [Candidatus Nitrosopolaris sp.]
FIFSVFLIGVPSVQKLFNGPNWLGHYVFIITISGGPISDDCPNATTKLTNDGNTTKLNDSENNNKASILFV